MLLRKLSQARKILVDSFYTNFKRQVRLRTYNNLSQDHMNYFKSFMDKNGVITDKDILQQHNIDWTKKYKGNSKLLLQPTTTMQVSKILQYCNFNKLPLTPQGGNTGLVGGNVPKGDEIMLNMKRMNGIINFNKITGILTCEAGCILQSLDEYIDNYNYTVPLDLASKGSCQIGGNVATNAGGIRLLRYGSLHGNIIGMECVLANGEVIDTLTQVRKDNTGYSIKNLMIGSEGTLGIITKISLLCYPKYKSTNVVYVKLNDFSNIQTLYVCAKQYLGEILSAFEFMDKESLKCVLTIKNLQDPFNELGSFYVLIETLGSDEEHDKQKIERFLDKILSDNLVSDGIMAQDETQIKSLWSLRENISESLSHMQKKVYKYDVSIPISHMYEVVEHVRKSLNGCNDTIVTGFGHIGDCNLHLNIVSSNELQLDELVYQLVKQRNGSISAEHGIGQLKLSLLSQYKSHQCMKLMKEVKSTLDPNNILNPYKLFHNVSI